MTNHLENELIELIEESGRHVDRHVRFDWLTNRIPTEPDPDLPPRLKYRLTALHSHLGGEWATLPSKRIHYLRFGICVDRTTLIEVDALPHFTSARLATLSYYADLDHDLDLGRYEELCIEHNGEADKYQRTRDAVGFPFPGGRTAQRAYFDAVKDLVAAAHGYRVIRVPAPTGELTSVAKLALRVIS